MLILPSLTLDRLAMWLLGAPLAMSIRIDTIKVVVVIVMTVVWMRVTGVWITGLHVILELHAILQHDGLHVRIHVDVIVHIRYTVEHHAVVLQLCVVRLHAVVVHVVVDAHHVALAVKCVDLVDVVRVVHLVDVLDAIVDVDVVHRVVGHEVVVSVVHAVPLVPVWITLVLGLRQGVAVAHVVAVHGVRHRLHVVQGHVLRVARVHHALRQPRWVNGHAHVLHGWHCIDMMPRLGSLWVCLAMALTRSITITIHSICIPNHIIIHIHVCMHRIVIVIANVLWCCCGDIIRQLLVSGVDSSVISVGGLWLRVDVTGHRVVACGG